MTSAGDAWWKCQTTSRWLNSSSPWTTSTGESRLQPDDRVLGPVIIGRFGATADDDADGLDLQRLRHSLSLTA